MCVYYTDLLMMRGGLLVMGRGGQHCPLRLLLLLLLLVVHGKQR
jgi:hypothetical protein